MSEWTNRPGQIELGSVRPADGKDRPTLRLLRWLGSGIVVMCSTLVLALLVIGALTP